MRIFVNYQGSRGCLTVDCCSCYQRFFTGSILPGRPYLYTLSSAATSIFLAMTISLCGSAALAGPKLQATPSEAAAQEGSEFVDKLLHRATTLGAYKVVADLSVQKKGKLSKTEAQFSFKSPSLLRVDVINGGMNTGAAIAVRADGGISAKGGPALLGLKMNLEKNSRLLRLPNGLLVTDCDFASLVRWLKQQSKAGYELKVTSSPIKFDDEPNVIVVELKDTGSFNTSLSQRVLVDPAHMVPVEWILFKEGALLSSTRFRNLNFCLS